MKTHTHTNTHTHSFFLVEVSLTWIALIQGAPCCCCYRVRTRCYQQLSRTKPLWLVSFLLYHYLFCYSQIKLARAHTVPFGGYKGSGMGREGGLQGIEAFLETKTVLIPDLHA
jgi:hypothetical protein